MIYSEQAGFKGHIGLTQITESTAEIDAVMLNPSAQGQGIGSSSLASLILWGQNTFGIDTLTLEVLSSNGPAIALYSKYGFEISDTATLKEITDGTSKILVDCKPGEKTTGLSRIRMSRKAKKF
jgi:RimJ/RimL family protein N-acetyltransferase